MKLYGYNHLIAAGCSNTSRVFGKPWSDYLAEHYFVPENNYVHLPAAGSGVGNYIDRVMSVLTSHTESLVIVQITDLRRLALGLSILDGAKFSSNSGVWFNGVGNYTWAYTGDKNWNNFSTNLNGRLTNEELKSLDIDEKACDFISKQIVMSDFTLRSSLMYLHALKSACDMTGSYLLLFPWFQNWEQLWNPVQYPTHGFNYIEQSADQYLHNKGYKCIEDVERGGHYGSDGHKELAEGYIIPKLEQTFLSKPSLI